MLFTLELDILLAKKQYYIYFLSFGKIKVAEEEFCGAKEPIKIWNVKVDNKVMPKLVET